MDAWKVPRTWRSATVVSFSTPGKSSEVAKSYLPISLTSGIGKLLEKTVNTRLVMYLKKSARIPSKQLGFRMMHSTTDALVRVTSDIHITLA